MNYVLHLRSYCLIAYLIGVVFFFHVQQSIGQSIEFREAFDVAVARAVAELRVLGR